MSNNLECNKEFIVAKTHLNNDDNFEVLPKLETKIYHIHWYHFQR